ncbi:phosphatidate cytidylyltransferase [Colwellia psychrerythraea]|uniref:Phosphatidate cytidylyltransferase n=1 Tax=Colwellia psychrerythraea TaxID=28229 RepID=A0A099KM58_COLPS|nr:phosphatidate cytidylyltransferase [Colwellia psychrerythraea]KGJ91330.1 phosphatidate cytidylyltransferase [Colwellia psychrerythraea]
MLKQRIITALILAPAAISAIFYLPINYFALLLMAIVGIGSWEWARFMGLVDTMQRLAYVVVTSAIIAALWVLLPVDETWLVITGVQYEITSILWLSVLWWGIAALLMFLYPKSSRFWANNKFIIALFGCLTLVPTWLAFMVLRTNNYLLDEFQGAQLLMYLFMLVWSADVGAYFVGKSLGKRKLMPNVSPGKTIEGFLGGVVCASILTVIVGFSLQWSSDKFMTALIVTLLITSISVLGDLTESMFKRQAGVKDSGTILPGHGGILDRIDSLTATAPVFALCYILLA